MVNVPTIARRELSAYFYSPVAYVVLTLFLLIQGWWFSILVQYLSRPDAPHGAVMQMFFGGTFLYWMFVIFVVATVTMRLVAEERRSGTIEALMTAPVTDAEVVLGKYLAALLFYVFLWVPTLAYVALLGAYAAPGGAPDAGPVCSGYLGTMLVGAAFLAVGLFASSLTRNQIIAAVLTFAILSLLLLIGVLEMLVQSPTAKAVVAHVNLFQHMEDFGKGIVDTRHVVFYLSIVALGLFGSVRALAAKKGA